MAVADCLEINNQSAAGCGKSKTLQVTSTEGLTAVYCSL